MIDLYCESGTLEQGDLRQLGNQLTLAVLRAEGVAKPGPFQLDNTAFFAHISTPGSIWTAADDGARVVRVQIITPPNALTRNGQLQLTKDVTEIISASAASKVAKTWVILSEAAEGGWGIAGVAYGKEEFAALATKAKAAATSQQ
jgi:phenylpyruvate tautomerase PptA (4-oxalocrotonate tautomerase family)